MARYGAAGDDAVKLEVTIDGNPASLTLEGSKFRFEKENGGVIERDFSIASLTPGSYSVLIGGRNYEVIAVDGQIRVNGRLFAVEVFDPRGMRGRKSAGAGVGPQKVIAAMPGKVVRLLVAEGDTVEAGQGLVVVEAMKMQNEMKSPKAGRVVEVRVKPEATVAIGDVLLVIE
jgi:biotin carboxyl carrier protein